MKPLHPMAAAKEGRDAEPYDGAPAEVNGEPETGDEHGEYNGRQAHIKQMDRTQTSRR
jgi:hypothetical protein